MLSSLFKIEPDEQVMVVWNLYFSLLLGGAIAFLQIAPLAIFLSVYPSSWVSYVFAGKGLAIFFVGFAFKKFEKKLSLLQSLLMPLITLSISMLLFWIVLQTTDYYWAPMALYIWSGVVAGFLSMVLSALMIRTFTLSEGKKFFGLLSGSQALGGALGGLLVPLLIDFIGVINIFSITAFLILSSCQCLFLLKKHYPERFREQELPVKEKESGSLVWVKNKNYVLSTFTLMVLSIFSYYSVELLFNFFVKHHFKSEHEIANFLGIFLALINLSTLFTGFFLFRITLEKLGLIIALLITPLSLFIFLCITILLNLLPQETGLVFPIFCLTYFLEKNLRSSINSPAVSLLYSPLKPAIRDWVQVQYKMTVQPIATSLIGVILLVLSHFWGVGLYSISLFIFILTGFGFTSLIVIKNNYLIILKRAISKWAIAASDFPRIEKNSLILLKKKLESPHPEEVIFVLQQIQNADSKRIPSILVNALDHSSPDVRCYALQEIEKARLISAKDKVEELCRSEQDLRVLVYSFRALGAISDLTLFKEKSDSVEYLIGLILYGDKESRDAAIHQLNVKAESSNENDRLLIANALKEVEIPDAAAVLLPLINNTHPDVRNAAAQAAGRYQDEQITLALIENLTIPCLHASAKKALIRSEASDTIIKNFHLFTRSLMIQILAILGEMPTDLRFLETFLNESDRGLLLAAARSLRNHSYKGNLFAIEALLDSENQKIISLVNLLAGCSSNKCELLHILLSREIELCQECCFLLLTFIYPRELILSATQGLATKEKAQVSYGIEILLQTLSKRHAKQLLPQLCYHPEQNESSELPNENSLLKVIEYARNCYLPALNSAALYTIGLLDLKQLAEAVRTNSAPLDPLQREMKKWTLKKLKN